MNFLSVWWHTSSNRERTIAILSTGSIAFIVVLVLSFVIKAPIANCHSADEARTAAAESMTRAEHAGPEDKCDAYRQMSALLIRYQTDWRRCAPFSGRDADANIDVQLRFYDHLSKACG